MRHIRTFDNAKRSAQVDLLAGAELTFGLVYRWMQENLPEDEQARDALYVELPEEFAFLVCHMAGQLQQLIDKHGEAVIDELVAEAVQVADEYIEAADA